jgi:hypothetical protein
MYVEMEDIGEAFMCFRHRMNRDEFESRQSDIFRREELSYFSFWFSTRDFRVSIVCRKREKDDSSSSFSFLFINTVYYDA